MLNDATNEKHPLPFMSASFVPGQSDVYIENILDDETKTLALCERFYYRGEGEACYRLAEKLMKSKSGVIRISARLMTGFGALCMGDSKKATQTIQAMRNTYAEKTEAGFIYTEEEKHLVAFINNLSIILIHLEGVDTLPLALHTLPMGIRLIALYVSSHQHYLNGEYGEAIGIAKTALSLKDGTYPVGEIYLNLVLAMSYLNQKNSKRANEHFLAAWVLAQPERFFEPFAEHHGLLCGMVEIHLKKDEPEAYAAITEQVYRFAKAWRDIHNLHNNASVADVLTTTEFSIAMLASKGWSNEEIAQHLGVSVNTVKTMLKKTYKKLIIKDRKDLKNYMLK